MKILSCARLSSFALITLLWSIAPPGHAADTKLNMGTGGKGGYYFKVGDLLCKSFVKGTDGYKCSARATDGARENLPELRRGKFEIVVARSDWAQNALDGSGAFKNDGPDTSLRSLFSIHNEALTVIARTGSGIASVKDLSGKRVHLGGSASRLVRELPNEGSWDTSAFRTFRSPDLNKQRKALCSGNIDAVVRVVGYPSGWVQKDRPDLPD